MDGWMDGLLVCCTGQMTAASTTRGLGCMEADPNVIWFSVDGVRTKAEHVTTVKEMAAAIQARVPAGHTITKITLQEKEYDSLEKFEEDAAAIGKILRMLESQEAREFQIAQAVHIVEEAKELKGKIPEDIEPIIAEAKAVLRTVPEERAEELATAYETEKMLGMLIDQQKTTTQTVSHAQQVGAVKEAVLFTYAYNLTKLLKERITKLYKKKKVDPTSQIQNPLTELLIDYASMYEEKESILTNYPEVSRDVFSTQTLSQQNANTIAFLLGVKEKLGGFINLLHAQAWYSWQDKAQEPIYAELDAFLKVLYGHFTGLEKAAIPAIPDFPTYPLPWKKKAARDDAYSLVTPPDSMLAPNFGGRSRGRLHLHVITSKNPPAARRRRSSSSRAAARRPRRRPNSKSSSASGPKHRMKPRATRRSSTTPKRRRA